MTKEQYLNKRRELMAQAKAHLDAGELDQFNNIKTQVETLDNQYEQAAQAQANYNALQGGAAVPAVARSLAASGNPAAAAGSEDRYDSAEYQLAFMNFVCRGTPIPSQFRNAAATTVSSDVGAVIPTTLLREIIRNLKERGVIFSQIRHLNIQGGVEIPISDLTPTASWVGDGASESQKLTATNKISFSYYGLECKIAQSILVSVVTIEEFQQLFPALATEAIITAAEKGVFNGSGTGQMLGICKDPRVTNVIEMTDDEISSWTAWKKNVFAKIPLKYQAGKFYMSLGTFESKIDGMVDSTGQPIGRVNYGITDRTAYRFGGKDVQPVEPDVLPDFEAAASGDVVAVFADLKNYIFNSNMAMQVVQWVDHDTNTKKTKVLLICDGKPADVNGMILIKKKVAAAPPSGT